MLTDPIALRWPSAIRLIAAAVSVLCFVDGAAGAQTVGPGYTTPPSIAYKDIWDPLARIFDAFGFDRCMWGTDWTRAVRISTYKQGVDVFRVTDRLSDSERAALMGDRLQQIYNWH